jgi:hypothetical protein
MVDNLNIYLFIPPPPNSKGEGKRALSKKPSNWPITSVVYVWGERDIVGFFM